MAAEALTEKVSVNMNISTLSSIDLLVDNGYYSNRSDFINQAVRSELQRQQSVTDHIIRREERTQEGDNWFIGLYGVTARDVEEMHRKGEQTDIRGYGMLIIHDGCDEENLFQVVRSITVKGKVKASAGIKAHYGIK